MKFETLPEHLIQKVLEFFQTKKVIKNLSMSQHNLNQLISKRRKNLINGSGIKTDLKTVISFSGVCKRFNQIIKSDVGKLIFTVHLNSKELEIRDILHHISYCNELDCRNICHYVNKDTKYVNIVKKIAIDKFNDLIKTDHSKDLAIVFRKYLTIKQVESYYKIKKINKKLKDFELNETPKLSKSSELDSISLDPEYSDS